jgi:hypothetical protein
MNRTWQLTSQEEQSKNAEKNSAAILIDLD